VDRLNIETEAVAVEPIEARWVGIVSLALGVFALVTSEFLPASLLTPMAADLGVSIGAAGQSVTATSIVAGFAGIGVVIGTSRLDRRNVLLTLTALLIVSSVTASLSSGLTMLLASRVLLGIGLGGFWAMSVALAMRLVPGHLMPRAMSIVMGGVSLATVCAAPIGAWVGATLGWRYAFAIPAVLGVITFILQATAIPALPPTSTASFAKLGAVLRRPAMQLCLGTILLVVTGHFAGFTYIRPFLENVPHFGVEGISGILLAFGIGGFIGNFVGGYLAGISPRLGLAVAASGIAAAMFITAIAGASPIIAAAAIVLWGLSFGAFPVNVQAFLTQAAGDEAESGGALMLTAFQIAISAGAIIGGLVVDSIGPLGVFAFAGVMTVAGTILISAVRGVRLQKA
jgi:predicted MFS family arabinose efflux permease